MFCHNCGKQILDGANFCGYCGSSQAIVNVPPATAAIDAAAGIPTSRDDTRSIAQPSVQRSGYIGRQPSVPPQSIPMTQGYAMRCCVS